MNRNGWKGAGLLAFIVLVPGAAPDEDSHLAPGNFNPLVPGYFADPTIRKFGDTWYLYATTDGTNVGRGLPQVWTSKDFVNWTNHRLPRFYPTEFFWAPDVTRLDDGRFFMVHSHPCVVYGYTGGSPFGPWESVTRNKPLVPDHLIKGVITLDGQTFRDDDGSLYLTWCTWAIYPDSGCGLGRLNPDLSSFAELKKIPNTEAEQIFEGPFLFKRKGTYYLTYSCGHCENETYHLRYAASDKVTGPYKAGRTNPILKTTADGTVHGPGHHSVFIEGDDHTVVYHRHNNPHTGGGFDRQVCADRMFFEDDGAIRPIKPTHKGVGFLAPSSNPFPNLAFRKPVTASSTYGDDYRPEYAVDDNNGTLWRPANNVDPAWIRVDLGSPQRLRRVHTQFEYATFYYQYLVETSLDGETWSVYSDRRANRQCGSPMVDYGDAEARFVRVSVTGTERQGFTGAIWNLKAYADAEDDPPQEIVRLEAEDLPEGELDWWENTLGMLGGRFVTEGARSRVEKVAGRKAVMLGPAGKITSSAVVPRSLGAGRPLTVAAWICDGGNWRHLAYTTDGKVSTAFLDGRPSGDGRRPLNFEAGRPFVLDAGLGGAVASLRVFNRCLWPSEIAGLAAERYEPPALPGPRPQGLLAHLEAADLVMGSGVESWPNRGKLGGAFTRAEGQGLPRVDLVAGVQAVVFDGASSLGLDRPAPRSLSGNGSFTAAAWVFNPEVAESETVLNWARRGGPDSTYAALMYGRHGGWGAAAHWGWPDMGWKGGPPRPGQWHHLAVVFDGIAERLYVDGKLNDTESKMLWLHPDSRIYVGAAGRGEQGLSGAIASARLYDVPLPADEIAALASAPPSSGVVAHLAAANQPYGPSAAIPNQGSAAGDFRGTPPPVIADSGGCIAVTFDGTQKLVAEGIALPPAGSWVAVARGTGGTVARGGRTALSSPDADWHHLALTWDASGTARYVDGAAAAPPPAGDAAGLSIGEGFRGAIALCQLYERALTAAEVARLCAAWKSDRTPPKPDPASLAEAPRVVTPAMVTLAATRSEDAGGRVQYWFSEAATGAASGWLDRPAWRHDGLEPDREYSYTVKVRDAAGNVTAPSASGTVRTDVSRFAILRDDFEKDHDYKSSGSEGTAWDGVFGAGNAAAARASGGRLHLESPRSYWIDQEPKGLLVYKVVAGDFTAEAELADMMGLAKKEAVGNQAGGLMVRVGDLAAAGPGEDLLLHSIFPSWGCGNIVTSLDSGGRPEWTSRTGWNLDRFLQMERRGLLFHFRTSRDGKTWTDMPGSPVERRDLKDLPLQVGLYHATHGGDKGWVEFRRFRLYQRRD